MNNVECESCVKRKTMYCPNSFKCYATKDKPYWQNRIMLLEENNQLKEQCEKQRYAITENCDLRLEIEQLKEQRQELRTWLENEINKGGSSIDLAIRIHALQEVLNKLNELEGGKNGSGNLERH